jgi:chain length determinant protein EpsF
MNSHQLYLVLRARWGTVVLGLAGCIALAVLASLIMHPKYTGKTDLVIDAKSDPSSGVPGTLGPLLASYVITESQIVASERVARLVVKMLKFDQDPDFRARWMKDTQGKQDITTWLANLILDRIRVTPTKDSNVINIAVKWPTAQGAADVANAFAQATIDTSIDLKVEPARQYAAYFDEQAKALRAALDVKRKRLSDFQSANGIVATDDKLDVENARLTELSTELVTIQGLRQDSQSRQRQIGANNDALPEVMDSTVIHSLKENLATAQAKQADIASSLGRNHPDYKAAVSQVNDLRHRIDQEVEKITASLGTTNQVNVRRENEVRLALEAQKKRVLELKHQHDVAADLESDVTTAQRDLDSVTDRLAQSNLESLTQQTNVVQLSRAMPPLKPTSPNWLLNIAIGLFLGIGSGIGAAVFRERRDPVIREESDLTQYADLPLLARIGMIKKMKAAA